MTSSKAAGVLDVDMVLCSCEVFFCVFLQAVVIDRVTCRCNLSKGGISVRFKVVIRAGVRMRVKERDAHPSGGQVLHAPGHLVGTGHQVFEGELLLRHFGHIKGVVHARGAART